MRLHVFSDLHVDAVPGFEPWPAGDMVVVAGDVCEGVDAAFGFLRRHIPLPTPIVFVAGNHEFYGRDIDAELALARAIAPRYAITFLENALGIVGGVRFIGATLWTDYDFYGEDLRGAAVETARVGLNDHVAIRCEGGTPCFMPWHARQRHGASRAFIESALSASFDGPTVVITHHAPHERSVHPRYRSSLLTAAFVSDLSELMHRHAPALWVHGHTHASFDYRVGRTRVVCNPAGYGTENPAFDPALIVDLSTP